MTGSSIQSLTSGEIAKYCGVTLRTVIRWLDTGKLKGYKLPGRGNNRILLEDFLAFLDQHGMPIPDELTPTPSKLVLIVDDELSMAKSIQRVARKANLDSVIANDGFQAGLLLSAKNPVAMTLDLSMPGMNGFDVIKRTREQADFSNTKILVISALGHSELNRAIELGADHAMNKPFDPEQLLVTLESMTRSDPK